MDTNGMSEDEQMAYLEMIAALPRFKDWGTLAALTVESALQPALEEQRIQSCLHAVDQAAGVIIGQTKQTTRTPFFCAAHPERLLCDNPGNHIGPGCVHHHMVSEHKDEVPAICFVCKEQIEESVLTPVFAEIRLHQPLTIYTTWDRAFQYVGKLTTLPLTYLCPRHAPLFSVKEPWVIHWPMDAEDLTPEDVIGA